MAHKTKAPRSEPNPQREVIDLAVELRGFTDAENKPRSNEPLRRHL